MRRLLALAALAALLVPASASGAVELRALDSSGFPKLTATLVADRPVRTPPVLLENGVPVTGLEAQSLAHAKAVVLAIDESQSMRGRSISDALAAARSFVSHSGPLDQLSLVVFGSKAISLIPFSDKGEVASILRTVRVDPQKGTALYDAVVLSAQAFAQQPLGGRVILLLTDGKDYGSKATVDDAVVVARSMHAAVYAVGIKGPQFDPAPLTELAKQTGGSFIAARSTADLARIYSSIADELARTWQVSYLTAARPGDNVKLTATLGNAGSASASITIRSSSGAQPKSSFLPRSAFSLLGQIVVALIVALLVVAALYSLFSVREGSWVRSRLAPHLGQDRRNRRIGTRERLQAAAAIFRATENTFGSFHAWKHLTRVLTCANVPLRTVEFVYVMLGAGFLTGFLLAVLGTNGIAVVIVALLAALAPYAYLRLRMRRRLAAFERQLADLLVTIGASLKAGHSFKQGLQAVVDEGQEPASSEFKRVLTETALGRPMDEALRDMSERLSSEDFDFVITAVTIQRQVGGSLADLFDMVADTIRQRQQFRRKVKSLTAMGRMSAYVLVGLPFFLAVVLSLINPEYMSPLFTSFGGRVLIVAGVTGIGIGALMLRKIVSFKG